MLPNRTTRLVPIQTHSHIPFTQTVFPWIHKLLVPYLQYQRPLLQIAVPWIHTGFGPLQGVSKHFQCPLIQIALSWWGHLGAGPLQGIALVAVAVNDTRNKTKSKMAIDFLSLFDVWVSKYKPPSYFLNYIYPIEIKGLEFSNYIILFYNEY